RSSDLVRPAVVSRVGKLFAHGGDEGAGRLDRRCVGDGRDEAAALDFPRDTVARGGDRVATAGHEDLPNLVGHVEPLAGVLPAPLVQDPGGAGPDALRVLLGEMGDDEEIAALMDAEGRG